MFARLVLLGGVCLFLLSHTLGQENCHKPSTTPEQTVSPQGAVIDVGPGSSPPRPIFSPDPDYPLSVRKGKHKVQGICVLGLTVDERGRVRDVHVTRSLDKRLDQNAVDAVKQWRFRPAMKDGKPVAVLTSVEVDFRLY
jgi:periplasmic protein TonB